MRSRRVPAHHEGIEARSGRTPASRTLVACALLAGAAPVFAQAPAGGEPPGVAPGAPTSDASEGTIVSRDVVVVGGETLRDIARRELGRAGYAPQLADFNQTPEGEPLVAGSLVRIPLYVPARGEVATVVFVKGTVTIDGAPLDPDAQVAVGAILETEADGFLSLEFSSGSTVNLQPLTTVTLQRLNCLDDDDSCIVELDAARGGVRSDVETRDGQPVEFRVTTPYATAAVRGTTFDLAAELGALRVGVTEGTVAVASLGTEVPVPDGFGSVTREGEPPGEPQALLFAPVFRNVPTRASVGDAVRWWGPEDVARWFATLSLDSLGLEVVTELDFEADADDSARQSLDLADASGLEPGDYTLNLRGVDDAGLKGYVASTRVTLAAIDASLARPAVSVTPEAREFLVQVTDPDPVAEGYEIQIATDPDFTDPLAADVGPTGGAVFRLDADTVYARARALVNPRTVSGFGATASSDP